MLRFVLITLSLPVAKLLGLIDWSWWLAFAPIGFIAFVILGSMALTRPLPKPKW